MRVDDCIHFCPPARLVIEVGSRRKLPDLIRHQGFRNGLLVTDEFFSARTPWVHEYVEEARRQGITTSVYAGGQPDPTTVLCDEATAQILEEQGSIPIDHVIALGGGSNIDLAKALCVTLPNRLSIREFGAGIGVDAEVLPLIAMPTTAGTGSEATPGTILFDPESGIKTAVMDNRLRPCIALIDPELTYTCPPKVTAEAGVDALTHAIESYLTQDSGQFDRGGSSDPGYSGRSSLTMLFAKESIRLCAAYLLRSYRNGQDVEARVGMCYASIYAALSYGSAGLNAIHGIAYGVAARTHQSHGATNAVVLPYVIDELLEQRHSELLDVARLFGIGEDDEKLAVRLLPAKLKALVGALDIPTDLHAFGLREDELSGLRAESLGVARLAKAFPVADVAASYERVIQRAWTGTLQADRFGAS